MLCGIAIGLFGVTYLPPNPKMHRLTCRLCHDTSHNHNEHNQELRQRIEDKEEKIRHLIEFQSTCIQAVEVDINTWAGLYSNMEAHAGPNDYNIHHVRYGSLMEPCKIAISFIGYAKVYTVAGQWSPHLLSTKHKPENLVMKIHNSSRFSTIKLRFEETMIITGDHSFSYV